MGGPRTTTAAAALSLAVAWSALGADAGATSGTEAPGRSGESAVWFDYLSNVLYERDSLTVCVGARVGAWHDFRRASLVLKLTGRDGKAVKEMQKDVDGHPPGGGKVGCEADFGPVAWKRLTVQLIGDGTTVARAEAICFGEDEPFPKVRRSGERLVDAEGRIAVFRLRRRTRKEDRSWILLRRATGAFSEGDAPVRVTIYGERLGEHDGKGKALAALVSELGTKAVDLTSPRDTESAVPVLRTLAEVGSRAAEARRGAAVLVLPAGDVDHGVRIEEYRRAVGLATLRLKLAGCAPVVLVGPVNFSAPRKQLDRYVVAVSEVAWGHRAGFVDPRPALRDDHFVIDPKRPRVFAAAPNTEGLRRLAAMIFEELKRVRPDTD